MLHLSLQHVGAALVTGASRGIGRALALRLGAAGISVAVNYRSSEAEASAVAQAIQASGARAAILQADVGLPREADNLVRRAEEALGPLGLVVNNAGITRDRLVLQMTEADWDAIWTADFAGMRSVGRSALAAMTQRGRGSIVNVSSVVGLTGNAGQANYAAAKSAVMGLTQHLALIGASQGVTVNCVVPGFFETDATAHLNAEQLEAWRARLPMGRFGHLDDLVNIVMFLASEGGRYVTGQAIAVDGGFAAGMELGYRA